LERFPGYTLSTLLEESTELARLVRIEELGGAHTHGEEVSDGW
jgi:hypothetical protein